MNQIQLQQKWTHDLAIILAIIVVLLLLAACGQANQIPVADSSTPNVASSSTNHVSISVTTAVSPSDTPAPPTATLDSNCFGPTLIDPLSETKEQEATAVRRTDNCIGTKVALTHAPVPTLGPPPLVTPEPTLTPNIGAVMHCDTLPGGSYITYNCWQGVVSGQITGLIAGHGRLGAGYDINNQSLVVVYQGLNFSDSNPVAYSAPAAVGMIIITGVSGSRVTLAQAQPSRDGFIPLPDGATFVFDLATLQWVSWDCGIGCTPTPAAGTPVMTLTP